MTPPGSARRSSPWAEEAGKFAAHAIDLELNSRAGRYNFYAMVAAVIVAVLFVVLDRETEVRANVDEGVVAQIGGSDTNALLFIGLMFLFLLLFVAVCMVIITLVDMWLSRLQAHSGGQDDEAVAER